MSEYSEVKKNYILNSLYQVIVILIPVILTPYLTRTLGSAGLGEYAYYYSCASYFTFFSVLGIPNYGNRAIAKVSFDVNKRTQTFLEIYKLQLMISICTVLIYTLFVHFILEDNIIAWMFLGYVLAYVLDISWLFFGMEKFKVTLARNFIIKAITIFCVLLLVKSEDDVYKYAFITSFGTLIANVVLLFKVNQIINISTHDRIKSGKHMRHILLLFIPSLAVSIYKVMDKLMLGSMTQMDEVGVYESSERIINIPLIFVTSLGTVMMPRISNLLGKKEEERSQKYLYKSILYIMFLSSAMCFGVVAIADIFVPVFFGSGFEKCISILTILMPSCIFVSFANVIRTQYLLPHEMDKQYVAALLIGAGINLLLNLLLIPRYASIGASIGTLVTEIVVCFFQCFSVRKYLELGKYLRCSMVFVIVGIIMSIFVRTISLNIHNIYMILLIKILLGIVTYLLCFAGIYGMWRLLNYLKSIDK